MHGQKRQPPMQNQDRLMEAMDKLKMVPPCQRKEVAKAGLLKGLLMAKKMKSLADEKPKTRSA